MAAPTLELLLAGDGGADVVVLFGVEQAGAGVGFGEAFEGAVLVLEDASVECAGDADVEGAGGAAHDVGVAGWHGWMVSGGWFAGCDRRHPEQSRRTPRGWVGLGCGTLFDEALWVGLGGEKGMEGMG